ncbi:MAG: sigma-70 family RNA polymerase sigma factor [Bacteroidota bacterium]
MAEQNNWSDEVLMQRIQSGERKYFELLFDRYQHRLFNFMLRFVRHNEKAEDLLQDLFIKVMESPEKFNAQKKFSTWIYTLAINLCRNDIRNSNNRQRIVETDFQPEKSFHPNHHEQFDQRNFKRELNALLETMDEENKTILLLRFYEELTIPEISAIVLLPEGTVKSRLFYLLKKLATQLHAYNPAT